MKYRHELLLEYFVEVCIDRFQQLQNFCLKELFTSQMALVRHIIMLASVSQGFLLCDQGSFEYLSHLRSFPRLPLNIFPSKIFLRYAKVLQLRGVQL